VALLLTLQTERADVRSASDARPPNLVIIIQSPTFLIRKEVK